MTDKSAREIITQLLERGITGPSTADAMLAALEAGGFAVVPKVPTEAMHNAATLTQRRKEVTTDVVKKCARALLEADIETFGSEAGAIAVIDALADGVSDEMLLELLLAGRHRSSDISRRQLQANGPEIQIARRALSAAIRAAKSREG